MRDTDPALETLSIPIENGSISLGGATLFLRARAATFLRALPALVCEQTFKPAADALTQAGYVVDNAEKKTLFDTVLLLPPRQRDESRALFARAVSSTRPGGTIVACAANDAGAKSHEGDLEKLAGAVSTLSKNKCRVFWSTAPNRNEALLQEWLALDAVRPILDGRFQSRPGIFAWDRIDLASALLAQHLPSTLTGAAADLGAGFGYLSAELLQRCPRIATIDLYEAELRALELAKLNLSTTTKAVQYHWHDVTAGLPRRYDVIVTNPPFHAQGSADRPDIGRRFISVAAQSLNAGGRLWLVANRHLPYESILDASFGTARIVAQAQGFKVIEATKTAIKSGPRP